MNLKNKELAVVVGGAVTAALLNAILSIGKTIFDIGMQIGRNIRRFIFG